MCVELMSRHVMARESFEGERVAAVLNERFVNVKGKLS